MILMSGDRFSAEEAFHFGLVNKVVAPEALAATVAKLTATLAVNAPLSLRANKHTVKAVTQDPANRDMATISANTNACFDSADYAEGRRAFMEKRKPVFTGR